MRVGWNDDHKVYGVVIPVWLGVADTDVSRRRVLMLPIPINFVYACGIWVYIHIQVPRFNRRFAAEYRRGFQEGFAAGEKSGQEKHAFEVDQSLDKFLAREIGVSVIVTPLLAWVAQFASWHAETRQGAIDALTTRFCRWCGEDTPCYCMRDD